MVPDETHEKQKTCKGEISTSPKLLSFLGGGGWTGIDREELIFLKKVMKSVFREAIF